MLKKIMMASLAVGALALGAPVAQAAAPTYDCNFNSVQQDSATGQNYEGAAWGYVVDSDNDAVSIQCYITVNGSEVAATTPGSGTGFAQTSGRVTFTAEDTDTVLLCARGTAGTDTINECYPTTHTQVPPQEVIDALAGLDPIICPVIQLLAGDYAGVITINAQGDVFLLGDPIFDCPPYDLFT